MEDIAEASESPAAWPDIRTGVPRSSIVFANAIPGNEGNTSNVILGSIPEQPDANFYRTPAPTLTPTLAVIQARRKFTTRALQGSQSGGVYLTGFIFVADSVPHIFSCPLSLCLGLVTSSKPQPFVGASQPEVIPYGSTVGKLLHLGHVVHRAKRDNPIPLR